MPYGRRHYRRRARRPRRRVSRGRKRRRARPFKKVPKGIKRAGRIACPVVYECIKKLADNNRHYAIKSCNGTVSSTASAAAFLAAADNDFDQSGGPFTVGTNFDECGYLGIPIFTDPNDNAGVKGTMMINHTPASRMYSGMPLATNVFPLIAKMNPGIVPVAGDIYSTDTCRLGESCMVTMFDNRHSLRIQWPSLHIDSTLDAWDTHYKMKIICHEVVWWIPSITTVEDNKLVLTLAECVNEATAEPHMQTQRKFYRQLYNAYFCPHPNNDDVIVDTVDITTGTFAQLTFNAATADATRITEDNLLTWPRDRKEFMATGIIERKQKARLLWQKKRTFRRPKSSWQKNNGQLSILHAAHDSGIPITTATGRVAVLEAGVDDGDSTVPAWTSTITHAPSQIMAKQASYKIMCGRKFNINKKMHWEKVTETALPPAVVKEVCPRGCYAYVQYWFFQSGQTNTTNVSGLLAPKLFASFTHKPDKFHILNWQNL